MRQFLRFLTGALVLVAVGACSNPDEQPTSPAFKNARALYNQDSLSKALPLFKQAADAAPENGVARAWVAVAHEQMGNWANADTAARTALSLSTCNNVAHTVLADIYNPQYGWDRANADTAWTHAQQAVECDETDGNAWLSIWNLSVKRGRWEQAQTAMRRLHETGFIPPKMQAVARWQLRVLPDSALFLTNGDWDTYPPLAVQAAEGVRTDVAVVNFNMLNAVPYADRVIENYDLPRPMSRAEMEAYTPRRGENGRGIYLSDVLLRRWRDLVGENAMDRPLILAPTIRSDAIRKNVMESVANVGPYYRISPNADAAQLDTARIVRAFQQTDGARFVGPVVSPTDRSSTRQTSDSTAYSKLVLGSGIRYALKLRSAGHEAAARDVVTWAESFLSASDVPQEGVPRYTDRLRFLKRALGLNGEPDPTGRPSDAATP